jgi:membrane-associated phospholipid phosphatase
MKSAVIRLLLLLLSVILPVSLFVFIAHEIFWEKEVVFDTTVSSYMYLHPGPDFMLKAMTGLSFMASPYLLVPAYLMLIIRFGWLKRNTVLAIYILSAGLSGFFVTFLLKWLFHRARPSNPSVPPPHDFSFPSGHSSAAFIFYGLLIYLLSLAAITKSLKYLAFTILAILSLLIGFSRVYLRVHYASDVLAGFCIGIAWLSLSLTIIYRIK